jgi:hypothetical protein
MQKGYLILRRASASRPSGEWNDDDYGLLANGEAVGRIFKANVTPVGWPWMWTLIFPHHEGRSPTQGYEAMLATKTNRNLSKTKGTERTTARE